MKNKRAFRIHRILNFRKEDFRTILTPRVLLTCLTQEICAYGQEIIMIETENVKTINLFTVLIIP